MKKITTFFIFISCLATFDLFGQPGTLDNSFDNDGIVTTAFGESTTLTSMVIQKDDKILVAGYTASKFVIVRYMRNGEMDKSFGTNGKVETKISGHLTAMVILSDGKIIVGGESGHMVMARYLSNGLLDKSFGLDGIKFNKISEWSGIYNLTVLPNDSILVSGYAGIGGIDSHEWGELILFNKNATDIFMERNFSFYNEQAVETDLKVQKDSKIVVSYPSYRGVFMCRYNTDLTPDTSFNKLGGQYIELDDKRFYFSPSPSVTQADGKILICGTKYSQSNIEFVLIKLNANGGLDNSFGDSGKVITIVNQNNNYYPTRIALEVDGKILIAGMSHEKGVIIRYKVDGTLDSLFGINGISTTSIGTLYQINCIAIQADGKILAAGNSINPTYFDFSLSRYHSGINLGVLNPPLSKPIILVYPNPIHENTTLTYTLKNEEFISIQLIDMQGKLIKTFLDKEKQPQGEYKQELIFPEGLAAGNYNIVVSTSAGQMSVKIIKD